MPLFGSGGIEGTWIGNDGNLPHAGTGQKCPSLFTTLEEESDVEFSLEMHGKKGKLIFVYVCPLLLMWQQYWMVSGNY